MLSIIPIRDGLASVILWLDVPSKLRFTSQLAPSLAAFEPHFVNRLSTRSSLAGGTISVADRAIHAGDLVLVEFPLISMPGAWPEHDNVVKLEVTLQTAVGALPAELQATYKALANTWDGYTGPDHRAQGELTGILNTNAYTLHGLPGDDIIHYCGVFAALSRINHRFRVGRFPLRNLTRSLAAGRTRARTGIRKVRPSRCAPCARSRRRRK